MLASNPLRNSRSETLTGATRVLPLLLLLRRSFPDASQNPKLSNLRKPPVSLTHPLQSVVAARRPLAPIKATDVARRVRALLFDIASFVTHSVSSRTRLPAGATSSTPPK